MNRGVRAILKHYSSTVEKPQHEDCPDGRELCCKHKRDAATGENTYHQVKDPIAPAIQKIIEPVFENLGDKKFMESCKNIATSNNNEAYYHILWGMAPKEAYCSPKEVEMAVFLSVCIFNSGFNWTFRNILFEYGIQPDDSMLRIFTMIDNTRIYKSDYHSLDYVKKKRQVTRKEKNKLADAFQKKDYNSGAFHAGIDKKKI